MSKLRITVLERKGRAVIANKFIKEGELILTESPLISAQFTWNKEYGYLCCDHCFLPLESAQENVRRLAMDVSIVLPKQVNELADQIDQCNNCQAKYCSPKCASSAAASYHNFECNQYKFGGRFYEIHELWKKSHYPPETATIDLVIRIFGMIKQSNSAEVIELLDNFSKHSCNEDLQLCHKMLGEKFSIQLSQIHKEVQRIFGNDDQLAKYISYDGFVSLLAILGTNAQGIGTSSFAHWVQSISEMDMSEEKRTEIDTFIDAIYSRFNDTVGEFLDNEGSGLYVQQSKFNHSCQPNAQIIFPNSNSTLNVVALQDIHPEEEICISYIDECMLSRSRHSRQKYLKENYLFRCECEKCGSQIEDLDVTSEEDETEMDTDEDN
ncbi:unnamed protein product [Chironomus riparius]|uniref:SET domain-containing protein n=1 Tax=Chironomus riparius TaxID=315576 RepID=A0A9N9WXW7_9DIPT|nr:unnamed protein product [Chironomus riparius]